MKLEISLRTVIILVSCVCAAAFLIFLILKTPRNMDSVYNTYERPENFSDGVWIVKYPDNQTCFRFETPDGRIIVTDPYNMDELVKPDIVTISHPHLDHGDISSLGKPYALLTKAGEFNIKGIRITGVAGSHNSGRTLEENVCNVIYVFDIDGLRIAQFASQGALPSKAMFDEIGRADVLILQLFSGGGKLSLQECTTIARTLEAKLIIPAHGDTTLIGRFAELMDTRVEKSETGEIVVMKSSLDTMKRPKVMVLDTY